MFSAIGDRNESQPSTSSMESSQQPCRLFQFHEILLATDNFDESLVIGRGGFGKVYKGKVLNGSTVSVAAIKRLDPMSSQGASEFWAEVEMLSKLRHCHLVSLFGYCNSEKEKILIYEYMPNGTLEDHLHKPGTTLSWLQRLKICIGAARGLDYLHTGTGIDVGIIHRDVKSSNILLHESWAAKISDFGLSKTGPTNQPLTYVSTLIKGTFGYFDPHYFSTGRLTRKSDVYAFGVVLFEVLCKRSTMDESLEEGLATWAQNSIKQGKLKDIIDSDIRGQISTKCLKGFAQIAGRCLLSHPKQRPTMAEVVVSLNSVLTLQEKTNTSLQAAGKTLFGKILDMFPSPSNRENSAHDGSKLSRNSNVNSKNAGDIIRADNMDFTIPTPSLKEHNFADLERVTRNLSISAHDDSNPSRNSNVYSNNTGDIIRADNMDFTIPTPSLKEYNFAELEKVTRNLSISAHDDSKLSCNSNVNSKSTGDIILADNMDFTIPTPSLKEFNFADLERVTRNFSQDLILRTDDYGKVYIGWLDKNTFRPSTEGLGIAVAIRRCRTRPRWETMPCLAHPNIVRLLGSCYDIHQKRLLVYEHVQMQNFGGLLYEGVAAPLSWGTRVKIMIGVARGLAYMHNNLVVHCDVQSSNIFLDQDFNAKVGNFELERYDRERETGDTCLIHPSVAGAYGYADPAFSGKLSAKNDVYSFGVVLLETLTGRQELIGGRRFYLIEWASLYIASRSKLKEIVDPRLKQNYPLNGVFEFAALALRCVAKDQKDRPSSEEVLQCLEQISAVNK